MSEQEKQVSGQKDANVAADTRPIPSQAEGDRETVEQDLQQKDEQSGGATKGPAANKD